ncbi:undecaprenyl/decaprenyl-phosphate alpha-N-acetylglucosaminyl 1-phosphate transferase [Pseudohongiella spirulinae]|uniref:Undecaprenyl-phosphate alpha-N-acetylglucosaminyl 1-phosphate transferase n=1 Tax=Pseudohongiella spirulinae TaxID=1249552 RepID=A0A0S2KE53_9GAMM|nr:undecaprenyl/decaprenyl-phosphate alpha-N-acetylglucosaminyl 1-phosphate transferase [Pseudohongiella spirulinae]ALO46437.1 UDP-GlcNAc:undecaprenyl-phosphate GlcNAc-1-phosphate transferase [Pseudohongiella spirulinae]
MALYALISTFAVTCFALLALRPLASRVGLIDIPGGRKTHQTPTPMIGGLGIYLGTLAICMLSPVLMNDYLILLAISGLVLFVGVLDDLFDIRASLRMSMHAVAAWVMAVSAGIQIRSFGDILFLGPVELGLLAVPVTLFATVGVINAVNMSDGLDGLSGGLVVIALVMLSIAALSSGQSSILSFSQILIVSLLAFLAFNFRLLWKKSALVYLGDAGSTLLGFILAWLVIAASQGENAFIAPVTALWFLAVPLIDTVSLLIRRPLQGRSPFSPGRDHLHHRLLNAGFNVKQTVLMMHGAAIVFGLIGLAGHFAALPDGMMFTGFLALFAIYMFVSRRLLGVAEDSVGAGDSC